MPAKAPPKRKPSVLKRARQAEKHNMVNKAARSKVKTVAGKAAEAIQAKDAAKVKQALIEAESAISAAALKGVLHKNTASRKISRLAKKANAALKQATA